MEKTHWKKAFKSDYLSSSDIDGKDLIAMITHVTYSECMTQSGKKYCNLAHFSDKSIKPMILNVTNSKIVKKFAGNAVHIDDWKNIKVQIYVDSNVRFGLDTVEGLRIRTNQPTVQTKKPDFPADKISDAIKFINDGKTLADLEKKYFISEEIKAQITDGLV